MCVILLIRVKCTTRGFIISRGFFSFFEFSLMQQQCNFHILVHFHVGNYCTSTTDITNNFDL